MLRCHHSESIKVKYLGYPDLPFVVYILIAQSVVLRAPPENLLGKQNLRSPDLLNQNLHFCEDCQVVAMCMESKAAALYCERM